MHSQPVRNTTQNPYCVAGNHRSIHPHRGRTGLVGSLFARLFPALPGQPLDFPCAMHSLIKVLTERIPEFVRINPERILVGSTQSRTGRHRSAAWARVVAVRLDRHRLPTHPPLLHEGQEIDYLITFCLPRYFDLTFEQKLSTVIHELYHISPDGDGGLRLMGRRKFAHGSHKRYDELVASLSLMALQDEEILTRCEFLRYDYRTLLKMHGGILIRPLRLRRQRSVASDNLGGSN